MALMGLTLCAFLISLGVHSDRPRYLTLPMMVDLNRTARRMELKKMEMKRSRILTPPNVYNLLDVSVGKYDAVTVVLHAATKT